MDEIKIDLGTPGDDIPVLDEAPEAELPRGATRNPDGSVTVAFDRPVSLTYRQAVGGAVKTETLDHLVLHRVTGAVMRKIQAKTVARGSQQALAAAARMTPARAALLWDKADAADLTAVQDVIAVLLDLGEGLPAHATEGDDGAITLPLRAPAQDGEGRTYEALVFRRMTGADMIAIAEGKDPLVVAVQRAQGISPKAAAELLDAVDAADVVGVQRVVGFLSGIGRTTGR